jgi:hypothetical protein
VREVEGHSRVVVALMPPPRASCPPFPSPFPSPSPSLDVQGNAAVNAAWAGTNPRGAVGVDQDSEDSARTVDGGSLPLGIGEREAEKDAAGEELGSQETEAAEAGARAQKQADAVEADKAPAAVDEPKAVIAQMPAGSVKDTAGEELGCQEAPTPTRTLRSGEALPSSPPTPLHDTGGLGDSPLQARARDREPG